MEKILHDYLINQVPLSPGLVVSENTSLEEVILQMKKNKTGCVVTSRNKKITGIFTERDLLNKVIAENISWESSIKEFATPKPTLMMSDEPLRKALYIMRKKNFRHIPIFESNGKLRGVLSIRNVIRLFAEHFPDEVMNLPPRLHKHPTTQEGG